MTALTALAQAQNPVTIGNQGTAGPASMAAPLLSSNKSLVETVWCKANNCVLQLKKLDGRTVVYTYKTRAGTIQVWRAENTGRVEQVRLVPANRQWDFGLLNDLYAMTTGQNSSIPMLQECKTSQVKKKELFSGTLSKTRERFAVNCIGGDTARPAVNILAMRSASAEVTSPLPTAPAVPSANSRMTLFGQVLPGRPRVIPAKSERGIFLLKAQWCNVGTTSPDGFVFEWLSDFPTIPTMKKAFAKLNTQWNEPTTLKFTDGSGNTDVDFKINGYVGYFREGAWDATGLLIVCMKRP